MKLQKETIEAIDKALDKSVIDLEAIARDLKRLLDRGITERELALAIAYLLSTTPEWVEKQVKDFVNLIGWRQLDKP